MKLSESEVGDAVFDWLAGFRWSIAHGGGIAPGTPSAGAPTTVRSRDALERLNPCLRVELSTTPSA